MQVVPVAFLDGFSPGTLLILGVIAVLLFGERLPEVSRSLGKKIVQFKKSVQNIQEEFRSVANSATSAVTSGLSDSSSSSSSYGGSTGHGNSREDSDDRDVTTAPKFVPPPSEPQVQAADA